MRAPFTVLSNRLNPNTKHRKRRYWRSGYARVPGAEATGLAQTKPSGLRETRRSGELAARRAGHRHAGTGPALMIQQWWSLMTATSLSRFRLPVGNWERKSDCSVLTSDRASPCCRKSVSLSTSAPMSCKQASSPPLSQTQRALSTHHLRGSGFLWRNNRHLQSPFPHSLLS